MKFTVECLNLHHIDFYVSEIDFTLHTLIPEPGDVVETLERDGCTPLEDLDKVAAPFFPLEIETFFWMLAGLPPTEFVTVVLKSNWCDVVAGAFGAEVVVFDDSSLSSSSLSERRIIDFCAADGGGGFAVGTAPEEGRAVLGSIPLLQSWWKRCAGDFIVDMTDVAWGVTVVIVAGNNKKVVWYEKVTTLTY